jgi:hypothetical protein
MATTKYSAQEESHKMRKHLLRNLLVFLCSLGAILYFVNRKEQSSREALAKSRAADANAYANANAPFRARTRQLDEYADSIVQEDKSSRAIERMALGVGRNSIPKHPRVLKKPYPTIEQVEQAIGKADSMQPYSSQYFTYPKTCAAPSHIWHMKEPICQEGTASNAVASQCDRILLVAGFADDGHLCYLETYQGGMEAIGRDSGVWSFEIHGSGDQHPGFK